jgi:hypothetical protein
VIGIAADTSHLLSNNVSDTTEEVEVVRNREPGPTREQQQNGLPDTSATDDGRLRDHHIEEMLSAFKDLARLRESASGSGWLGGV